MSLCVLDGLIFEFKTLQPQIHSEKISEVIIHFAINASFACNSDSLSIVNVNKENGNKSI